MSYKEDIEEALTKIESYAEAGLTHKQIAYLLGKSPKAMEYAINTSAEVREAIERGKAKACQRVLCAYWRLIENGDRHAIMFYLRTQAGWRETTELKHSGELGTFNISMLSKQSKGDVEEIARSLLSTIDNTAGDAGRSEAVDGSGDTKPC